MTTNTIEQNFFLTPHFSLKEMTASATAAQLHITNCPNATQIARLKALCEHVLEPIRQHFGAIRITSGFRSVRLNDALCANSLSQHTFGEAADIYVPNREKGLEMFRFICQHCTFDQMLLERKRKTPSFWLHVSYKSDRRYNRNMAVDLTEHYRDFK